jgi:signal transduction histidine kinase
MNSFLSSIRTSFSDIEKQSVWTMILVIVIGYVVTFLGAFSINGFTATPFEIAASILLGAVYTLLAYYDVAFFGRFPSGWGKAAYFTIEIALIYGIQWLIGPGGIWLVSLPLAALAASHLQGVWRWVIYIAILMGMLVPLGLRYDLWEAGFYFILSVSPALFFVVVFTRLGENERAARLRAERLTAELEAANHQLSAYAAQVEELATTQERNRVAREIHDNLGHYLTVINVQIGAAKVLLDQDSDKTMAALDKAQGLTQEGLKAVRQSVAALRESPLGKRPLPEAIALLTETTTQAGIVTEFVVKGEPCPLSNQAAVTLYRVAQEGLTNVRKHARASRVDLLLDYSQADVVRLSVADNGVGTATSASSGRAAADDGFGLLGIRERVKLLGGNCRIESAPGAGFALCVSIPLQPVEKIGPISEEGPISTSHEETR